MLVKPIKSVNKNQVLWLHEEPAHESSRETKMGTGSLTNEKSAPCLQDSTNCPNSPTTESGQVASRVETDPLGGETSDSPAYNYSGTSSYNTNPTGFYGGLGSGESRIRSFLQERYNSWLSSMQFWSMTTPVGYQERVANSPGVPPTLQRPGQKRSPGGAYGYSTYYHGSSWNPRMSEGTVTPIYNLSILSLSSFATVGGGGGGGGGGINPQQSRNPKKSKGKKPKVDIKKLKDAMNACIKEVFKANNITVADITPVTATSNGSISYSYANGNSFTIETGHDFTEAQLGQMGGVGLAHGLTYVNPRYVGTNTTTTYFGRTISLDPSRFNYVGNDATGDSRYPLKALIGNALDAQVHENGHSLSSRLTTGNVMQQEYWGQEFEDCVLRNYK